MDETPPAEKSTWWEKIDTDLVLTMILIANAILNAYFTYQIGYRSGDADWENALGEQAAQRAAEAQAENFNLAYQHYRAFTRYAVNNGLVRLYDQELAAAQAAGDPVTVLELQRQRAAAEQIALDNRAFFPAKYLNPDGTYNIQRELDELWAEQALQKDVYPEPHFAQADVLRDATQRLNRPNNVLSTVIYLLYAIAYAVNPERSRKVRVALTALNVAALLVMAGWYLLESL